MATTCATHTHTRAHTYTHVHTQNTHVIHTQNTQTRWNPEIVGSLYDGVRTALKECGVKDANVYDATVPGSFELPLAARFLALSRQCDVVITIGCLIKGETMHFEYISEAVAKGLMDVSA